MLINLNRIKDNMMELGEIGKDFAGGITRKGFSVLEKEAHQWLMKKLDTLELEYRVDSVGNLIAIYPGENNTDIVIGSHLDTVPQGGMYDGALGVLAGLEVIETLKDHNIQLPYNIRLVAFVAEEGSSAGGTFGSRCAAGQITNIDGKILEMISLTNQRINAARFDKNLLKCYLELHIEQGGILEAEGKEVGVVTDIVGIQRFEVLVKGKANHAGTTPMDLRDDALLKTTYFIQDFYKLINSVKDEAVGTIGCLSVSPGAANVIPGEVELIIEMRSMDFAITDEIIAKMKEKYTEPNFYYQEITKREGTRLNQDLINMIENTCKELHYSYKLMKSGAGHDANPMAKITPASMIFVPSIGGISHSPHEYSRWKDIEKATNVLLGVVQKI